MRHKLTSKKIKAIHLLARGMNAVQVSHQLKLHRDTLRRWKCDPEFNLEFEHVMADIRGDLRHRILHLVDSSISTVSYGMTSPHCDAGRLRVALNVLKLLGIERELIPDVPKQEQNAPEQ